MQFFRKKISQNFYDQMYLKNVSNRRFSNNFIGPLMEYQRNEASTLFTGDRVNVIVRQSLFAYCPSWSLTTTIQFRWHSDPDYHFHVPQRQRDRVPQRSPIWLTCEMKSRNRRNSILYCFNTDRFAV